MYRVDYICVYKNGYSRKEVESRIHKKKKSQTEIKTNNGNPLNGIVFHSDVALSRSIHHKHNALIIQRCTKNVVKTQSLECVLTAPMHHIHCAPTHSLILSLTATEANTSAYTAYFWAINLSIWNRLSIVLVDIIGGLNWHFISTCHMAKVIK